MDLTFLQSRYANSQQAYEKMHNITNKEMQIKTTMINQLYSNKILKKATMRYHLTPIRMTTIKKQNKITSVIWMWRNQNSCVLLVGM